MTPTFKFTQLKATHFPLGKKIKTFAMRDKGSVAESKTGTPWAREGA